MCSFISRHPPTRYAPARVTGGYQQVQRALQPLRTTRQWAARATVRFETGPGEQAQVAFGQLQVWIADAEVPVHFFVFTLGFSRRAVAVAYAYRNERLDTLLDGHERALRYFGGVPLSCLYDNPRTITTGERVVAFHQREAASMLERPRSLYLSGVELHQRLTTQTAM